MQARGCESVTQDVMAEVISPAGAKFLRKLSFNSWHTVPERHAVPERQTVPENIVVHNPTQQSVSICVTEEAQRMIQRAIQKRVNKWKPPTQVERLANKRILYARGLNYQF